MEKCTIKFDSPMHNRLYNLTVSAIPLEESTAWINDKLLLDSCHQFYDYVNDGYDDILKYPEENYIDPFDPAFSKGHNGNVVIDNLRFHKLVIEKFLKAYPVVECNFIAFKNNDYDKLIKNTKNKYLLNAKNANLKLTYTFEDLLTNLRRKSLIIMRTEDETIITSEKYPKMFLAAKLLYEAAAALNKKTKRNPPWFINMDFRAINNPFRKVEIRDLFYPLRSDEKNFVEKLFKLAEQKKLKVKYENIAGNRGACFTYNKVKILLINWWDLYGLKTTIMLPLPGTEHDLLLKKVNLLDNAETIKDFCINNFSSCNYCNKDCVKNHAYRMGWMCLSRPIPKLPPKCSGSNFFISSPCDEISLDITKTLIDFYTINTMQ